MSVGECVQNAEIFIRDQGVCLLLFDVKGSRNFENSNDLVTRLLGMMKDLNIRFKDNFPEHNLAVNSRIECGFQYLLGMGLGQG